MLIINLYKLQCYIEIWPQRKISFSHGKQYRIFTCKNTIFSRVKIRFYSQWEFATGIKLTTICFLYLMTSPFFGCHFFSVRVKSNCENHFVYWFVLLRHKGWKYNRKFISRVERDQHSKKNSIFSHIHVLFSWGYTWRILHGGAKIWILFSSGKNNIYERAQFFHISLL